MQMLIIEIVSVLLACLPLMMAAFFLAFTLPRKMEKIKHDLDKLQVRAPRSTRSSDTAYTFNKLTNDAALKQLADKVYNLKTLILPALLLTVFYFAWLGLCDSYVGYTFLDHPRHWVFPPNLISASRPVLYAFAGVYLFNLGSMVRRLYLGDLNEQVCWGAINRLWLSLGLAIAVLKSGLATHWDAGVYFTIGFLANIILDWLLENTLKLLNVNKPKLQDLPLQMVKGIDLWKEYRLEEEGIENVQNLATADVTDLAVKTHYNLRTLIDWIDQSILITRLTAEQVKKLSTQGTAVSAIEFASASPRNTGNSNVADALAKVLDVDRTLMGTTMDRLFEDEQVQNLWYLWQRGTEGGKAKAAAAGRDTGA